MERMTVYDQINKCYKLKPGMIGRSIIQELGIYEDILQADIEKAGSIQDIRNTYIKKGIELNPYWEKIGKE